MNDIKRSEGNKISVWLSSQVLRIPFVVEPSVDNINIDMVIYWDNLDNQSGISIKIFLEYGKNMNL